MPTLSQAAASRMHSTTRVRLDKYSHAELTAILDGHVVYGLVSSRMADGAVEYIANLAAGDVQAGIALLRRAAAHVEDNKMRELTTAVVYAVAEDAQREITLMASRPSGTAVSGV